MLHQVSFGILLDFVHPLELHNLMVIGKIHKPPCVVVSDRPNFFIHSTTPTLLHNCIFKIFWFLDVQTTAALSSSSPILFEALPLKRCLTRVACVLLKKLHLLLSLPKFLFLAF